MSIRYPWPAFASPIQCHLTDPRLDGEPLGPQLLDGEHRRIRLDQEPDWDVFECDVVVETDEPVPAGLDRLIPYVMVSSTTTNTRMPFPLSGEPADGHLAIPRSTVSGSFTVQAVTGALVSSRRRVVGSSAPWTVVLDGRQAPVPPGALPFDFSWVDFASDEAPEIARKNPSSHAVMDLTNVLPRLLLNSGIEGLQPLLTSDYAQLERRRLRDILGSSIARYVAATVFRIASDEVTADDGSSARLPSTAMYRETCEAVAAHIPDISTVQDLYDQIVDAQGDEFKRIELWTRIDLAIDALCGSSDVLTIAAKEVWNG